MSTPLGRTGGAHKATGFIKVPNAIVIESKPSGPLGVLMQVSISHQDYSRVLSLMCEGSSREGLDILHRVVSQRRMNAAGAK